MLSAAALMYPSYGAPGDAATFRGNASAVARSNSLAGGGHERRDPKPVSIGENYKQCAPVVCSTGFSCPALAATLSLAAGESALRRTMPGTRAPYGWKASFGQRRGRCAFVMPACQRIQRVRGIRCYATDHGRGVPPGDTWIACSISALSASAICPIRRRNHGGDPAVDLGQWILSLHIRL